MRALSDLRTEWSEFRALIGARTRTALALALASILAGVSESGILAILAQECGGDVAGVPRYSSTSVPLTSTPDWWLCSPWRSGSA